MSITGRDDRARDHPLWLIIGSLLGMAFAAYLMWSDPTARGGGALLGVVCLVALLMCIKGRPYGAGGDG